MKKYILLLTVIVYSSLCVYAQNKTFDISLTKQNGLAPEISFNLNYLHEVKDISMFKIPDGFPEFVIGVLDISPIHSLYNSRFTDDNYMLKYQSAVEKNKLDTTQFAFNNLKTTKLHVLIYLQNGVKYLIVDTNFDNSFINKKVYKFSMDHEFDDHEFISLNIKLSVDSLNHTISRVIPVKILMNFIDLADRLGNNDSLQVYISPDFYYRGYFIDGKDTVCVSLNTQNFDQFYRQDFVTGVYFCKTCSMLNPRPFSIGESIQVKNHVYVFDDFDPMYKKLKATRLADSDTGTMQGNYFAKMPGLDTLTGYSLIFFTGSWCKPCKAVLDSLLPFHKLHPEITIISVNLEVDSAQFISYVDKYKIPWKIIYSKDHGQFTSPYRDKYNIKGVPALFLINPQRKILWAEEDKYTCFELLKQLKEKGCKSFEIFNN